MPIPRFECNMKLARDRASQCSEPGLGPNASRDNHFLPWTVLIGYPPSFKLDLELLLSLRFIPTAFQWCSWTTIETCLGSSWTVVGFCCVVDCWGPPMDARGQVRFLFKLYWSHRLPLQYMCTCTCWLVGWVGRLVGWSVGCSLSSPLSSLLSPLSSRPRTFEWRSCFFSTASRPLFYDYPT